MHKSNQSRRKLVDQKAIALDRVEQEILHVARCAEMLRSMFTMQGSGKGKGGGKRHLINEIATTLRAAGRHVHIVAFKNKQAVKFDGGMTIHAFCKKMRCGEILFPATVIWDEAFECTIFVHAQMVQFRLFDDLSWIYVHATTYNHVFGPIFNRQNSIFIYSKFSIYYIYINNRIIRSIMI